MQADQYFLKCVRIATVCSTELNPLEHFQGKLWCYRYMLVCSSCPWRNSSGKSMRPWEQAFVLVSGKWENGPFPFPFRWPGTRQVAVLSGLEASSTTLTSGAEQWLIQPPLPLHLHLLPRNQLKSEMCCTQKPRQVAPSSSWKHKLP